jgi:hypothetical protein
MQISRARACVLLNMYTFFQKLCRYVYLFHKIMPNLANFLHTYSKLSPTYLQPIPYLSPVNPLSFPCI